MESVRSAKDERVREIRNAVELMIARLDAQLKNKLVALMGQKSCLNQEAESLETWLHEVDHLVSSRSRSRLIGESGELIRSLRVQSSKPISSLSQPPVPSDFHR